MQGKVHVFIGVASLAAFCAAFPKGFEFANTTVLPEIGLVTAAFGSYLPDIDMQRTHMGQKHKVASTVVSKLGGGHRGITHTLLFPALLTLLGWAIGVYLPVYAASVPFLEYVIMFLMSILFGVEFGYVMHIFADLFNGKGCPLLWPISPTKIHILDLPSSGAGAWIFGVILVGIEWAFVLHLGGLF